MPALDPGCSACRSARVHRAGCSGWPASSSEVWRGGFIQGRPGLTRNNHTEIDERGALAGQQHRPIASVMISDSDIYRAASLLINLHGFDAMVAAAKLLDVSLDRGDLEARLVWSRVKKAIETLEARSTRTVH